MAGLAGGALTFSPYSLALEGAGPEALPPVRETVMVGAVQAALADIGQGGEGGGFPLRRSDLLSGLPAGSNLQPVIDVPDDGLPLRMTSMLGAARQEWPADVELPLRLSQMVSTPQPGAKEPLWMTVPDQPGQLRQSRELSLPLPGAAGIGQPARAGQAFPGSGTAPMAAGSGATGSPASGGGQGSGQGTSDSSSFGAFGWEIPPIRWGGSLGYGLQKTTTNTGYSSTSNNVFANLSASSYIYAPWLARVSGRIGLTTTSTSSQSPGLSGEDSNRSANVVGGGEVNMFSSSRYPFRAYFDRTDSRASGTIVTNDYVNNRYGMSQNFRSEDGISGGNVIFDRSEINSSNGRRDEVTALSGGYSTQTGIVQNTLNGRYSLGQRSGTDDRVRLIGLNSAHIANVSDTLNLGATMNYTDSDIRTASGFGDSATNRGQYLQLYTYGSWLPDFEDLDDLPLTLNGGLRYTSQENQFGGEGFSAQSIGGNLSGMYRFSNNLSMSANGSMNQLTQSKGPSQTLTQLGSSINYTGNPLTFGKFSYNWNTGANANWQSAVATTPSNTMTSGQASHNLSRIYTLGEGQTLAFNGSQSLNVVNSALVGTTQSLTHTVSANLGLSAAERFSGSLSTMVSDVRTTGYLEQHYQVLNVGFFGQGQLSQVSSANINLMFNWSDQSFKTVDSFGIPVTQNAQHMTLNGSAAYSHMRFAGVRGLRYTLNFAADTRLRDDRLYGNVNGEVDRARFALTNRLEYRIGLLDFRLSLTNNEVGGKKNALLFFQVSRQIGSY
ncbi:hypothetical protein LZ012_09150 [Dechloromonas sp. XY25]|uniref:TIGR03016 family PEP-CTERM system-associated outer membrane protein n=1 Tax=Dechloromonas hankyongensis TaxID=2908002 RepID=A0ABS9K1Z2_9RHOO|nr:hypothetical protein [Dechloromonas hankyongensis]MCG2577163.1 hypothetical protein [Dechloromonas hankyongensis]